MKFVSRTALPTSLSSHRGCRDRAAVAHRRRPLAVAAAPAFAGHRPQREMFGGKSFGRKRIEHAVEVAGACIMLAMFLLLALLA